MSGVFFGSRYLQGVVTGGYLPFGILHSHGGTRP